MKHKHKLSLIFLLMSIHRIFPTAPLANCGNTCFMNTVLQVLFQHKALRIPLINAIGKDNFANFQTKNPVLYYLSLLFKQMEEQPSQVIIKCTPDSILKNFTDKSYEMIGQEVCTQGDASEFLQHLFAKIDESDDFPLHDQIIKAINIESNFYIRNMDKETLNFLNTRKRRITQLVRYQSTLSEALKKSFYWPMIYNDKQVYKQFLYTTPPPGLIINIERQHNLMTVPLSLDISDYIEQGHRYSKPLIYSLHAVGVSVPGHWFGYAYIKIGNKWFLVNDSEVKEVSFKIIKHTIENNGLIYYYAPTAQWQAINPDPIINLATDLPLLSQQLNQLNQFFNL